MRSELVPYAVGEKSGKGRLFAEEPHPYRQDFERDRDRIIHCAAFRRLEGKTQVFTPGLDDHYRTRLTHTIEVAQIGRTIARALGLNEQLTEAICLAHDLGHSPFGHTGESVLNKLMTDFGGFEHNRQSLRIVDLLEHPYPDFVGLNLAYETRLGLAKHSSPYDKPQDADFPELNCSLEGQIANVADMIAFNSHDLEDGLRADLIDAEQLKDIRIVRRTRSAKAIIDILVGDCIEQSSQAIRQAKIKTLEDIYSRRECLIVLPEKSGAQLKELEQFLLVNFYQHPSLLSAGKKVEQWLNRLFEHLCNKPQLMPGYFQRFIEKQGLQRVVCDYIAGMTDRFCLKMVKEI
jgi:dGTPase